MYFLLLASTGIVWFIFHHSKWSSTGVTRWKQLPTIIKGVHREWKGACYLMAEHCHQNPCHSQCCPPQGSPGSSRTCSRSRLTRAAERGPTSFHGSPWRSPVRPQYRTAPVGDAWHGKDAPSTIRTQIMDKTLAWILPNDVMQHFFYNTLFIYYIFYNILYYLFYFLNFYV